MRMRHIHNWMAISTLLVVTNAYAITVNINPARDNTLFESDDGSLSNGIGVGLFSGTNRAGNIRRALIAFDVSSVVPVGATIIAVQLQMNASRVASLAHPAGLHRVLKNWGEGTSNSTVQGGGQGAPATVNDATWLHNFFSTSNWTSPGGDYQSLPSASTVVRDLGPLHWASTSQLVSDVQNWLENPPTNFGWIVITEELQIRTAIRFDSREHPVPADRPVLVVTYQGTPVAATTWTSIKKLLR